MPESRRGTPTSTLLRDRRGVALPLALLALVAVSLMVTTALVTSTTEYAMGNAYGDAARSLYTAERGLTTYLGEFAQSGAPLQPVQTTRSLGADGDVRITVTRLQETLPLGPNGQPDGSWNRVFSVAAEPWRNGAARGRAVIAMVRQQRPPPATANMNITSAITLGGDLEVNGNAFTVTGRNTACNNGAGVEAVRTSNESTIDTKFWDNFVGKNEAGQNTSGTAAIEFSTMTKQQLAYNVLGNQTLETIIASLPLAKKWGPRFSRPDWDGYLEEEEGVAVVDGKGGLVDVLGGKGMLIVVNGDVQMRGNASFDGIIITEGNFTLKGTPTVSGALISLDTDGNNTIDLDASAIANGHITVAFDKCKINTALAKFASASVDPYATVGTSFAWMEVVR